MDKVVNTIRPRQQSACSEEPIKESSLLLASVREERTRGVDCVTVVLGYLLVPLCKSHLQQSTRFSCKGLPPGQYDTVTELSSLSTF